MRSFDGFRAGASGILTLLLLAGCDPMEPPPAPPVQDDLAPVVQLVLPSDELQAAPPRTFVASVDAAAEPGTSRDFSTARFQRPEHVRGLYVNAWAAGSSPVSYTHLTLPTICSV